MVARFGPTGSSKRAGHREMMSRVAATRDASAPTARFPVIETPRLLLREVTLEDAAWYLRHFSEPEIVRGQGCPAPADLDQAAAELRTFFLDLFSGGAGIRWGLALRGSPELIGSAGFYRWRRGPRAQAELGYDLAPALWGRGLMTEALQAILEHGFGPMGLTRVEATILTVNARSARLLERLGFVREALLYQLGADETGTLRDEYRYALER
jgi:ribosomal-protein-alanine N-acetyltransferase